MRIVMAIAAAGLLTGCAGAGYVMEQYSGMEPVAVAMPDDTYRVFDKPANGQIMVTSSLGAAAGQGIAKGLTLGGADTSVPKPRFQAAVEKHLQDTGRANCRITDGYLLIQPQWEFRYSCPTKGA